MIAMSWTQLYPEMKTQGKSREKKRKEKNILIQFKSQKTFKKIFKVKHIKV